MNKLFPLIFIVTTTIASAKRPSNPKPGRAENAKVVLSNLAHLIGHIGTIVDNPRDTENVTDAVTSIIDNIAKIAVNAAQHKKINKRMATDQTNFDNPTLMDVL